MRLKQLSSYLNQTVLIKFHTITTSTKLLHLRLILSTTFINLGNRKLFLIYYWLYKLDTVGI